MLCSAANSLNMPKLWDPWPGKTHACLLIIDSL
jgi:hypothetical protein